MCLSKMSITEQAQIAVPLKNWKKRSRERREKREREGERQRGREREGSLGEIILHFMT